MCSVAITGSSRLSSAAAEWQATPVTETDETIDARFFVIDVLRVISAAYCEALSGTACGIDGKAVPQENVGSIGSFNVALSHSMNASSSSRMLLAASSRT